MSQNFKSNKIWHLQNKLFNVDVDLVFGWWHCVAVGCITSDLNICTFSIFVSKVETASITDMLEKQSTSTQWQHPKIESTLARNIMKAWNVNVQCENIHYNITDWKMMASEEAKSYTSAGIMSSMEDNYVYLVSPLLRPKCIMFICSFKGHVYVNMSFGVCLQLKL
jgi:hypothetical protein